MSDFLSWQVGEVKVTRIQESQESGMTWVLGDAVPENLKPIGWLAPHFIDEVGEATVVGGEGQLGAEILPGETVRFVDGSAGEEEVSVEYAEAGAEVFIGRAVPREALVIDDETYGWDG